MTTYLLITSDKPKELTLFVGPKKKTYSQNDPQELFDREMETAKASRLPLSHKLTEIGMHWFCTSEEFIFTDDKQKSTRVKIGTPVELPGWEPEIVYQEAYLSGEGEIWKKCSIDRFNNIRHLDCKRQAYRLKRSESVNKVPEGVELFASAHERMEEMQRCNHEYHGPSVDGFVRCHWCGTPKESPIEAKTQEPDSILSLQTEIEKLKKELIKEKKYISELEIIVNTKLLS